MEANNVLTTKMQFLVTSDISEKITMVGSSMEYLEDHDNSSVPEMAQVLDKIVTELSQPLTFEDDDFVVTVQELESETLQDGNFSKSLQTETEREDSSKTMIDLEIMFIPQDEIELLVEESEYLTEKFEMFEQQEMHEYDADDSEDEGEEEQKGDEQNGGVHYKHSCKRTYMFNPRFIWFLGWCMVHMVDRFNSF